MHFCTCTVALSGDQRHIMTRDVVQPVSWPEVDVLRALHGEDAVADLEVIADVPFTTRDEKSRLGLIYGPEIIESIYPGRNPQMQLEVPWPIEDLDPHRFWKNPLTMRYENEPVVETQEGHQVEAVGDLDFLKGTQADAARRVRARRPQPGAV